jgi:hypothetical protein
MTDELAAIEARDAAYWSFDTSDEDSLVQRARDRHVLLAALHAEQEARARVEAAARGLDSAVTRHINGGEAERTIWALVDARRALRAALAPDASGGEPT